MYAISTILTSAAAQVVSRQNLQHDVDASVPAMSDASGNVVPFSSTSVFQAPAADGQ